MDSFCICYDNAGSKDGIGAQVTRIISVFLLSKKYKIGYLNLPITSFDSNPGDNLNSEESKKAFPSTVGKFLNLSNTSCTLGHITKTFPSWRVLQIPAMLRAWVLFLKVTSFFSRDHSVFIIKNPQNLILRSPSIYRAFIKELKIDFKLPIRPFEIDIQIHIRRGFGNFFVSRYCSTDWYVKNLILVTQELKKRGTKFSITLHTDSPQDESKINTKGISPETIKYLVSNGISLNLDSTITIPGENFAEKFSQFDNFKIVRDCDPVSAWKIFQSADLIMLGKSTFSFVPALLNLQAIVISPVGLLSGPDYWHYLEDNQILSDRIVKSIVDELERMLLKR
jgi:predicted Zn-dependent protease